MHRTQDKAGADDGAAPVIEQLVFSEGDPDYEEEEDEDPARVAEEYDYEHFWDLAALEDAPPEDPLETELAAARAEYAELVRGPSAHDALHAQACRPRPLERAVTMPACGKVSTAICQHKVV